MQFLYICFILCQSYAIDVPEVNLKFYKNVKISSSSHNEIHDMIMNFKPIVLRNMYKDIPLTNMELYDKETKNALSMHLYFKSNYKIKEMLQDYKKYAIEKGIKKLNSLANRKSMDFHIIREDFPSINNVIKNFTLKAKQHFDKVNKTNYESDIDKEYLILDSVQIFNDVLYNEEINLLHHMIVNVRHNISKDLIINETKRLNKELIENKKDDMQYLCLKLKICRPFFGFTDNLASFLHDLIKLSDLKLTEILIKLSIPIKDQSEFFQAVMGETAALKVGYKLDDIMFRDISKIRRLFIVMRNYLTRSQLFNQYASEDANKRRKALRILVDIINKLFDLNGDEVMSIHFDLVSNTIANWANGRKNEIDKFLKNFVDHVVEIVKHNLCEKAQQEMKALIDILMRKYDKTNEVYNYIFVDGSKFMRGEDMASKLSLLF